MKAITIRQPWASLIVAGVKTIETRTRPTSYQGRIAIHAAGRPYSQDEVPFTEAERQLPGWQDGLPLGAVVGSAVLTDSVPIVNTTDQEPHDHPSRRFVAWDSDAGLYLVEPAGQTEPEYRSSRLIEDQAPFGDFTPGRWAWLLDDAKPTTERCPWCWGLGSGHSVPPGGIEVYDLCRVCRGAGRRDPVPARGHSELWEWTP